LLVDEWRAHLAHRTLVVTGAGMSLASGIPTFRGSDPDAVWAHDVTELGTNEFFLDDPAASWAWYLKRFGGLGHAVPNAGHHALAELERRHRARGGDLLVVTQNVDGLHRAAGSQALVEVHGRADRVRCSRRGCRFGAPAGSLARADVPIDAFLAAPSEATVPRCPQCGALVRQHVLWFDESYLDHADYEWPRVQRATEAVSLVVFVGTSFAVGVTDFVLQTALDQGVPVYSIDPAGIEPDPRVRVIAAASEHALPALVTALDASPAP